MRAKLSDKITRESTLNALTQARNLIADQIAWPCADVIGDKTCLERGFDDVAGLCLVCLAEHWLGLAMRAARDAKEATETAKTLPCCAKCIARECPPGYTCEGDCGRANHALDGDGQ